MVKDAKGNEVQGLEQGPFEPIAVIGVSALMPDAPDIDSFWQNILDSKVSIRQIPEHRWIGPVDHFFRDGGPGNIEEGYTYARIGAVVEGYEFDWRRWKQPPGTLTQIDLAQQWAVSVAAAAIEHAGYDGESKDIDRLRTGVAFANALGGENRNLSNIRIYSNHTKELAKSFGMPTANGDAFVDAINTGAPRVNEDTMPGELANVVAGRVSNLLDLQGPNFAMDAACASSLATLMDACRLLQMRQVDVMIAGATDRSMDAPTFAKFSAIGALSPTHSTPFDAGANGFVMGEGAGAFVLKRLSDAIRDGDEVHAVIRGVGGSSDGRGKGITAPSQRGQIQAIARAYSQAEYEATTVELIEAHGTSTKVGDATELGTLSLLWDGSPAGDHVAVGSIKSQVGHLKAAAGIAGLIKAVMSLHHRTIPPSAGFKTPNQTVDWDNNAFFVPTEARDWPRPENHPRRAGVSAFGFGGTNYHVALEGFEPEYHAELAQKWDARWSAYAQESESSSVQSDAASVLDSTAQPSMTHEQMKAVEGGILLLSSSDLASLQAKLESIDFAGSHFDEDPRGLRLSSALDSASSDYAESDAFRMCIVATSWAEFHKRTALASKAMSDPEKWGFLQAQGILLTNDPALHPKAKVAHMYPGQGSQYVGMTHDLHQRYSAVQKVWEQADETMVEVLDGETLSSFVLRSNLTKEERIEAEHKLKQTEYTQPAMLTADLAIERALNDHGQHPDMVAGHSLGEYAALMSAGILDMDGALRASAARGTEMGSVVIEDKGLMASILAPYDEVSAVIDSIEGYVIAANKNSPKMTVIAGETEPVKQAMAQFEEKGFQAVPLATSHAFHSRIVAPANEPLRRFLESLEIRWPRIPITANVDGTFYPMEGADSKEGVLGKLAPQMASAVEWTTQIETMYAAGARAFVEVGPKRALTMFAVQILEDKPHLPIMCNHPKQGGIATFLSALGTLALAGRKPQWPAADSHVLTEAFRAGPIEAYDDSIAPSFSTAQADDLRTRARPLPSTGTSAPVQNVVQVTAHVPRNIDPAVAAAKAMDAYLGDRLAAVSGYPARFCNGMVNLRLGLGMSDAQVASVLHTVSSEAAVDASLDTNLITTAADLAKWITALPASWSPQTSMSHAPAAHSSPQTVASPTHTDRRKADPYVVTGVSLGLPGGERVFEEDTFERLVRGETCISEVSDEYKQRLLDKNIVRLIKGRDGSVNMEQAKEFGDIPQLAGVKSAFDIAEEFGIDAKVVLAWDITTQLAVASGLLALRDAAIPLTPVEQIGKGGLRLIRNWQVPQHQRERTGIVFASCFPGLQMAMKHAKSDGDDGEGRFDRRYLFQTLNMGHSQFAQYTGIRGPNTTINLACASTTAAFGVAEDWLNSDRVDRVVIISADDVTGEDLWEWIGGGFAASGAAATGNVVEEAALPFDRRRNGLVLGMGAAAFVVERHSEAMQRGVQPIAELLGSTTANSAFHGTRLDVEHVAQTVDSFITSMESKWGLDRHAIAPNTVFFSHETYTPARGGSAQSEVRALRDTFGASTNRLVIANTKGFTGHPMGVGIEDASMFHGMKTGRIPPIANHKETDPELGNLNLSTGGDYPDIKYGLRFAAGFGSQMALSLVRKWPVVGERIDGQKFLAWSRKLAETDDVVLRILDNKLVAYVNGEENLHGGVQGEAWNVTAAWEGKPSMAAPTPAPIAPPVPAPAPVAPPPKPTPVPAPVPVAPAATDLTAVVIEVVVNHTGYPADFVELDQDLEGELGIDTVKQAEIMADIRDRFSLPIDEEFVLSDYPTLNHMIGYIQQMSTGIAAAPLTVPVSVPAPAVAAPTVSTPAPVPAPAMVADESLTETVVSVVVSHTGYPADFVELDQDLEGELGIDTVKQAEIMAEIRDRFSLPIDEEFVLSDYPTLNHMIGYIQRMQGGVSVAKAPPTPAPSVVTPAPVSAPAMPSKPISAPAPVGDADLTSIVVEVVVQHTGYPSDFIELDQDLEGELGIDTVKQAEIMAEIRDRFSLPIDEEFVLSDYPTLNHMIGYIQRMQGGSVVSPPASNPDPTPTVATPAPTPASVPPAPTLPPVTDSSIQERLIEVVVRHTGYPDDFIEMDQDLEGELGIDTVKQAEIMADVRDIFELPIDEEFVLSDHPTLNHFTAYIQRMKGGAVAVEAPPVVETPVVVPTPVASPVPAPVERQENCRRWQVEVEECVGSDSPISLDGTLVVTDDGWGIAEAFCKLVEAKGMKAVRVGFESEIRDMSSHEEDDRTVFRADPANPEHMAEVCKELRQLDIAGLVHMAPLKLAGATWNDDTLPSSQIALAAHGYFSLLQGLDAQFAEREDGLVASVTALDGRHGNIGERFNSVQCAASGVTKSYFFEQTHLRMRALDMHPELILDAEQAAQTIAADLFETGGEVEIGIDRDGRRWALVAFAEDLEAETTPLQSDDTWIVSGGGSGVTAASIIGVACHSLNAGAHFALLGRSSLVEETKEWVEWSDAQLTERKNSLRQELIDASDSGKVTMVQWNTAWQKFSRSRDVYITIKTIEETGNDASYHSVDVMDADGLRDLGASLGRPITGIIHGAGLEDSKLVASKDYNVFDKVIRVKVDGWQSLLGAVESSGGELRFASCFTSVSGRFGNNGQTDYSAANSILDAEMARLTASGTCRAVAVAWTGWRDVGMATRGSFQAVFDAAGIDTISVDKGVEIFVGEALQGGKRRVLGCGNLGTMDAFDAFREAPLRLPAEMASVIADPYRFPFVDKVLSVDERQSLVTQTTLSVADHPFLSDHSIEGVPYHPGVMAMEMFAENALLLRPSACLAGFEDVSFGLPVKLLKGDLTVRVHADLIRGDGEMSWVACRLVSDLSNSKGEIFGEREHHKAVVRVVESRDDLGPFLQKEVESLPQLGTPAHGELAELPSFIYRRYFHGPRFQSHGGVLRGIGDEQTPGADGIALMRHQLPLLDQFALETQGETVLLEALPMLIEAGFQNAGLVAMESEGFSSLPVGIEWSSMLRVPERDEVLRMRSLRTAVEDAGITVHDVVVVGDDDAPVLALKGLRLKSMAPVAQEDAFTLDR